jgi:hypothetical protein
MCHARDIRVDSERQECEVDWHSFSFWHPQLCVYFNS